MSGVKSYRNVRQGIFIHKTHHFLLTDSHFADNGIGNVDLDRCDGVRVENTKIVGESESWRDLRSRQSDVGAMCDRRYRVGIDIHTWKLHKEVPGLFIKNVDLSGFQDDPSCENVLAIRMDNHNLVDGNFELLTSFEHTKLGDGPSQIDFCYAANANPSIVTAYLIDRDGTLRPPAMSPTGTSTLISNVGSKLTTFVESGKCQEVPGRCFSYCRDTCFRSVRYEVDGCECKFSPRTSL
jgi:hypothetical protein